LTEYRQSADIDPWRYEQGAWHEGFAFVAGLDEAGRGPLAGPVVAACVILPVGFSLENIADSKTLTHHQREKALIRIKNEALGYGVGIVDSETIDRINILQATHLAMRTALLNMRPAPDMVLVDGLPVADLGGFRQLAIVKGDRLSASISAASIIAKVTRDAIMVKYHQTWSEYGFDSHKGYGSRAHLEALRRFGPCPIHRRSFAPVAACLKHGIEQKTDSA
jgi:ribonuclease HII